MEVDAMRIACPRRNLYVMLFQLGFDHLVAAFRNVQRQVIQIIARLKQVTAASLEQRDLLCAAVEKYMPRTLVRDRHSQ